MEKKTVVMALTNAIVLHHVFVQPRRLHAITLDVLSSRKSAMTTMIAVMRNHVKMVVHRVDFNVLIINDAYL